MDSADKLHNELMTQAFDKWNSLKPLLNQAQIDFVEKEIKKQQNSVLTWNEFIELILSDKELGYFNAIAKCHKNYRNAMSSEICSFDNSLLEIGDENQVDFDVQRNKLIDSIIYENKLMIVEIIRFSLM